MTSPLVVVTGANGLVGSHVVAALSERGARVRAVVRRPGTAPDLSGVEEHVGDFADPSFAAQVVVGSDALVTTVHPLGGDADEQRRIGLDGTLAIATAAGDAGVPLVVHISTAGVYDRSPATGDVTEDSAYVADDSNAYGVIKRDLDEVLARLGGTTRVLVRPPMIFGPGESSVWNTIQPAAVAQDESRRHANPDTTVAWVHVRDLATITADLATGAIALRQDAADGPVLGACTPVNVAAPRATQRDYLGTVCDAVGVEPVWNDEPGWTGAIATDRAAGWGWSPQVSLEEALDELRTGLRS